MDTTSSFLPLGYDTTIHGEVTTYLTSMAMNRAKAKHSEVPILVGIFPTPTTVDKQPTNTRTAVPSNWNRNSYDCVGDDTLKIAIQKNKKLIKIRLRKAYKQYLGIT